MFLSEIPGGLGAYSDSAGAPVLRRQIAAALEKRDGCPANPDELYLTVSSTVVVVVVILCRGGGRWRERRSRSRSRRGDTGAGGGGRVAREQGGVSWFFWRLPQCRGVGCVASHSCLAAANRAHEQQWQ